LSSNELSNRQFERILLIKPSALGDVIHTVPVLVKLRQRYPQAQIDWMLHPAIADWVGHHPAINRVIYFDRKALAEPRTAPKALWRLLRQLRGGQYDLVIDLHGQLRSAFFTLSTGAPVRIGFDRPRKEIHNSPRNLPVGAYRHGWSGARENSWIAYSHHIPIPTLEVHAVQRYLWLGQMLGFEASSPDFHVPIPPNAIKRVEDLLAANGISHQRILVMSPGTVWETKRWSSEGFAAVGRHFIDQGWSVVLAGSSGDRAVCQHVASLCPGAINLCGQTKVSELAALISRADLCVSNDSGPMHMAVALGRPVVSIFGPTDELWVGPFGRKDAVVRRSLPCAPCYLRTLQKCPNNHVCMREISADQVIARAEQILSSVTMPARAL
jgi:lipopolysaccharide heptosyltransferase I